MTENMVTVQFDQHRGNHVLALTGIPERVTVISSRAIRTQDHRDKYSIQIGSQHILIDSPGIYVNHSCNPNCAVQPNSQGGMDFISTRAIAAGEEIFWDYHSHEDEIATPFLCTCQADTCRGLISKLKHHITLNHKIWNLTLTIADLGQTLVIHNNDTGVILRFALAPTPLMIDSNMARPETTLYVRPHESSRLINLDVKASKLTLTFDDGSQPVVELGTLLN